MLMIFFLRAHPFLLDQPGKLGLAMNVADPAQGRCKSGLAEFLDESDIRNPWMTGLAVKKLTTLQKNSPCRSGVLVVEGFAWHLL